ncbi:FAD/NAD(P)-binding domain-containing protein [Madurella fahalii]|uniref:FAD/NAD(P)-binding domain-containing protein n=1 Tax=Madurella fahalii TaxID=1157608 RepID=A0ABQ0FY23_9PEZI
MEGQDISRDYGERNANTPSSTSPLRIVIIGAGIGGMAAAVGLRRNGHIVHLYEKSSFAHEFGAAAHMCPNASGILRAWGIFAETFGATPMSRLIEYAKDGELQTDRDLTSENKRWRHPWHLVYRVALHETLKEIATSEEGPGIPARLFTSSRAVAVDPEQGTVTLEDGARVAADVVIGADGIYSTTRKYIQDVKLLSSGKAAFRFMIPRSIAEADDTAAPLVKPLNALTLWYGDDRRVVMYLCQNNQLLNIICIHPEAESHAVQSDEWDKQASLDQVLKVYEDFDPRLKALFMKADPSTIKVWQLLDVEKLPNWATGKLALIGDAAHPFTPYQGQGAAQAIEDAAALSIVLPRSITPEEVPARLKLYESIRYERAHTIQHFSRLAGRDWIDGKPQVDTTEFQTYNFSHDEIAHASAALKE